MTNLIDRLAGYAGCTTDMQCEQIADVIGLGLALLVLGVFCLIGAALQAREARRYSEARPNYPRMRMVGDARNFPNAQDSDEY